MQRVIKNAARKPRKEFTVGTAEMHPTTHAYHRVVHVDEEKQEILICNPDGHYHAAKFGAEGIIWGTMKAVKPWEWAIKPWDLKRRRQPEDEYEEVERRADDN